MSEEQAFQVMRQQRLDGLERKYAENVRLLTEACELRIQLLQRELQRDLENTRKHHQSELFEEKLKLNDAFLDLKYKPKRLGSSLPYLKLCEI